MHTESKIERLTSIANFPFLTGLESTKTVAVTWSATDGFDKSTRFDFSERKCPSRINIRTPWRDIYFVQGHDNS